jgi:hypothetical protein
MKAWVCVDNIKKSSSQHSSVSFLGNLLMQPKWQSYIGRLLRILDGLLRICCLLWLDVPADCTLYSLVKGKRIVCCVLSGHTLTGLFPSLVGFGKAKEFCKTLKTPLGTL